MPVGKRAEEGSVVDDERFCESEVSIVAHPPESTLHHDRDVIVRSHVGRDEAPHRERCWNHLPSFLHPEIDFVIFGMEELII